MSPPRTSPVRPKPRRKEDRGLQLTIMLFLVSSTYVILYLPVLIHFLLAHLHLSRWITGLTDEGLQTAKDLTRALYVSGFAVNFFLYTMSGSVFSKQLVQVVQCHGGNRRNSSGVHTGGRRTKFVAVKQREVGGDECGGGDRWCGGHDPSSAFQYSENITLVSLRRNQALVNV